MPLTDKPMAVLVTLEHKRDLLAKWGVNPDLRDEAFIVWRYEDGGTITKKYVLVFRDDFFDPNSGRTHFMFPFASSLAGPEGFQPRWEGAWR